MAADGAVDRAFGGSGTDMAEAGDDDEDLLSGVEELL
jgi:hypothetical protein